MSPARPFLALARRETAEAAPWGAVAALAYLASLVAGGLAGAGADSAPGLGSFPRMVGWSRSPLALTTSLVPALAGALAMRDDARLALLAAQPGLTRARVLLARLIARGLALALGFAVATALAVAAVLVPGGALPLPALVAYLAAHALGILAFVALGALLAASAPQAPAAAAGAFAILVGPLWDTITFAAAFQGPGLEGLRGGAVPTWLLGMQAANPLVAYAGVMITVEPQFRLALEVAALSGPVPWFVAWWVFAGLLAAWILAGVGGAILQDARRARRDE